MTALGRSRAGALCLLVAVAHAGCAVTGTYTPRPSHRISKLDPAGRIYVRDGRRFEPGLTAGAEDLVSGNEVAVAYARRAHRQEVAGLVLYGVGLAALATGLGLLIPPNRSEGRLIAGNVLFWTSLVPMSVSLGLIGAGQGNLQDAVNIYNDELDVPLYRTPASGGR